jgi:hypothetical protein
LRHDEISNAGKWGKIGVSRDGSYVGVTDSNSIGSRGKDFDAYGDRSGAPRTDQALTC